MNPASPSPRHVDASTEYREISSPSEAGAADGWREHEVARQQDEAYNPLLAEMRIGKPRLDFTVAADAVRLTECASGSILEVGCGSGYYSEVMTHLLGHPLNYTGLDSSFAMVQLARSRRHGIPFIAGDGAALPFPTRAFDLVFNGVSLMHMPRYEEAICESRRVTRRWCVFHTVPLLTRRPTAMLMKHAYGGPVIEIIFREESFRSALDRAGFTVRHVLESIPYDLSSVLGEHTLTKTFVCEVTG